MARPRAPGGRCGLSGIAANKDFALGVAMGVVSSLLATTTVWSIDVICA